MPFLEFRRVLRSEEHTSELQSHDNLVCRLLLEKTDRGRRGDGALRPRGPGPPGRGSPQAREARAPAVEAARASLLLIAQTWATDFFFLKMGAPRGVPPSPPPAFRVN